MFPQTDLQHLKVQHLGGSTDYFFSPKKKKCLIHISGVHGVEGHLGSMIQAEILKKNLSLLPFQVVIVHIVNPYGFTHSLRTNQNNVDLNRNVLPNYRIDNPDFAHFEPYFRTKKMKDALPILSCLMKSGFRRAVISAACGQTDFPKSVFFAGHELQSELVSLRQTLSSIVDLDAELFVLDVHTGLGKLAEESIIVDGFDSEAEVEFFQKTFQKSIVWPGRTPGSFQASGPVSQLLKNQWKCFYTFHEFGTYSPWTVLQALLSTNSEQRRETFFPKNPRWRSRCTELGLLRFDQLVQTLSGH